MQIARGPKQSHPSRAFASPAVIAWLVYHACGDGEIGRCVLPRFWGVDERAAQKQGDPEGGIHPGRWRSWEVKAVSQLTTKSTEYWSSRLIFPSYFADCCNCFVTHSALLSSKAVDARAPKKVGELLTGIKHPCLHRALGDADDGAHLFDRLLMVVDQVDDLAVRRRQLCHTGAQDFAGGGAIERSFRRVGFIRNFAHVFLIDVL